MMEHSVFIAQGTQADVKAIGLVNLNTFLPVGEAIRTR
jgi:hypothetical protein